MFSYAIRSSLGDDVYFEPSTAALEEHIAQLAGKEAGIFLPTGTMSNQIALRTLLEQPPYSVLCDVRSHVYRFEAGGLAFHSGAHSTPVIPSNGHHLTLEDIEDHVILSSDVHVWVFYILFVVLLYLKSFASAPTRVITLENTLNGTIIPQNEIYMISEFARSKKIKMHLDGARIWHVAAETNTSIRELCSPFDSVSLCLSKGLGAPIGTCLVGTKPFIRKARWFRKLLGAGMRQTGFLAGAAAYALANNFQLLPRVHALAKHMQQGLEKLGVGILSPAETCMVFYDPDPIGVEYWEVVEPL
ncbi:hypothetical protein SERLADRAFT_467018 [Serpula lacrymans var. lacrymans S7.9]|uniref:Aromatic amino acid beta-eliminating lyase/threonine aldolase domain-containing protein n=1 Tax=Serpula lacrymans var. lacrymans (strain S7.9) TaxID=578457 RepID=F8NVE6_SERL9|nr:uncharacterized protein SERLADRAFT_467018 [Serpula lacrymans var. lacrymans S7.9]EGO26047.1 hypothetical protein SERLADRAFT_467018 [Serpula lacrymans var. lacrymans S7.9]